ncbi:MAG: YqhA family protein [Mycobacterium sp.]
MLVEPTRDSGGSDSNRHPRHGVVGRVEDFIESGLFGARWLLVPFYVGLAVAIVPLLVKFIVGLGHLASVTVHGDVSQVTVAMLELLDIVLIANLVLIVVFAGYESFVSKMEVARVSRDRPSWMGKVDYSSLKMKLIGSIVAISAIGLLQDFIAGNDGPLDVTTTRWRVVVHCTFLLSGLLFATMDLISEKRRLLEIEADKSHAQLAEGPHG